jgi:hypothetical protein
MDSFATPNFAAGGTIFRFVLIAWVDGTGMMFVLAVWAVVLACFVVGIIFGARLLRRGSAMLGWLLVLVSCLLPIFCYVAPPHLFRLAYGSYPLGDRDPSLCGGIKEGMSRDEVQAILGPPHRRSLNANREETWTYFWEWYGVGFYAVKFGPDGRVRTVLQN